MSDLTAWMRGKYQEKAMSQFTYHSPLVAAYFESILFDGPDKQGFGAFNIQAVCKQDVCKYGAWGVEWSVGAADFFVGFGLLKTGRDEQKAAEYAAWKFQVNRGRTPPKTHPDIEDSCVCHTASEGTTAPSTDTNSNGKFSKPIVPSTGTVKPKTVVRVKPSFKPPVRQPPPKNNFVSRGRGGRGGKN